jgi:hypothetical protein
MSTKGYIWRLLIHGLLGLVAIVAIIGCGGGSALGDESVHVLSPTEAERALLELPYQYKFRHVELPEGATGALAGRAVDQHHIAINFGIALGKKPKEGIRVPRAGNEEAYGYGGFIYTNDLQVPGRHGGWMVNPRFHTTKEWHHAADINVAITEKLCRAETQEPCHEG